MFLSYVLIKPVWFQLTYSHLVNIILNLLKITSNYNIQMYINYVYMCGDVDWGFMAHGRLNGPAYVCVWTI